MVVSTAVRPVLPVAGPGAEQDPAADRRAMDQERGLGLANLEVCSAELAWAFSRASVENGAVRGMGATVARRLL